MAVCQKQRSPRVWARLCAHSRGEGWAIKPPLPCPQDRPDCRVPGRQTPAISRTTAAGLPGGQHGTQRMQQLAGASGRPEGLSAEPRFVLAQAPAEGGPKGLVPDVSERSRQRRTKRAWRGDEADEGPGTRPGAREVRRKTSTGEATQERNPASFFDEPVRRVRANCPGSLWRSAETPKHGTQRASRHRDRHQPDEGGKPERPVRQLMWTMCSAVWAPPSLCRRRPDARRSRSRRTIRAAQGGQRSRQAERRQGREAAGGAARSEAERGWSTVRKGACRQARKCSAGMRPPEGPGTGKCHRQKMILFCPQTPGRRSPQRAITGATAERPTPTTTRA